MNHESNRAERYIRTLNDVICRNLTGIGEKWPLFVLPSCWAMNTQVSQVTGFSPYEMVYLVGLLTYLISTISQSKQV